MVIGQITYYAVSVCLLSRGQNGTIAKSCAWIEKYWWYVRRCGLQMMETTGSLDGLRHGSKKSFSRIFCFQVTYLRLCHKQLHLSAMHIFSFLTRTSSCPFHLFMVSFCKFSCLLFSRIWPKIKFLGHKSYIFRWLCMNKRVWIILNCKIWFLKVQIDIFDLAGSFRQETLQPCLH